MAAQEQGVTLINGTQVSQVSQVSHSKNIQNNNNDTNKPTMEESPRSVTSTKKDEKPPRFLNGWSKEQERLMSEWSDIAMCYRWIHDKSEKFYHSKALWINLPVIVLTTLGGTANFGIQSVFSDDTSKQYASFAIGGISLFAGLLTTVGNYLRYAQLEESHRVASIAWGKFQRLIAVELALNPLERMDSLDFLKICRSDLDRLIEQSPPIPEDSIQLFEQRFSDIQNLKKPDICGALEHTRVFESSEARLKQMAVDAAIMLKQRRNMLTELTMPKIEERINAKINIQLNTVLEERKKKLEEEIEMDKMRSHNAQEEFNKAMEERQKKIQEEIDAEKKKRDLTIKLDTKRDNSNLESRLSMKKLSVPVKSMYNKPFDKPFDTPRIPTSTVSTVSPIVSPIVTPRLGFTTDKNVIVIPQGADKDKSIDSNVIVDDVVINIS